MKIKIGRGSWLAAVLVSLAVIIAGCVQSGTSLPSYVKMVDGVQVVTINAKEFAFTPAEIHLNPGKAKFILINGGSVEHELVIYEASKKDIVSKAEAAEDEKTIAANIITEVEEVPKGESKESEIIDLKEGTYEIGCHIVGHFDAGMKGTVTVGSVSKSEAKTDAKADTSATPASYSGPVANIVRKATDVPPRILRSGNEKVVIYLETKEVVGELADGVQYKYWTYNGTVPGPMLRVKEGDTVEFHLKNNGDSTMTHSIDLHAVSGQGGGASLTQVKPGEEKVFTFRAINPGIYIYHCASPHIPTHISNGMYGMILVEPKEGLPQVDKEFYVVQGEIYSASKRGEKGMHAFSFEKMQMEQPEYYVFNGKASALTGDNAMKASVGDKVRIYIGVGAFKPSSFHVIGEIFDTVYPEGSFSDPHKNVQTTFIPAGGAAAVEFKIDVPANYILVDHSLTRTIDKGALAIIQATGPEDKSIFSGTGTPQETH
ncbi:MAG: nitrite reductase, copper-containing [Candidatus Aenigmarchaeota archaeon]|nr:nitrite reductase, copper-containing [Candidatus Aenigmarchaeota archaeon]